MRKNVYNLIQTLVFTVKSLCEGESGVEFHEYPHRPFPNCDNFSFDTNLSIPVVIIKSPCSSVFVVFELFGGTYVR